MVELLFVCIALDFVGLIWSFIVFALLNIVDVKGYRVNESFYNVSFSALMSFGAIGLMLISFMLIGVVLGALYG